MAEPTHVLRSRRLKTTLGLAVLAAGLVHCSSTVESDGAGAGGGTSTTSTTSSTSSSSGTDSGTSTGTTTECGDDVCGADELCDYFYSYCSSAPSDPGFCDPIQSECIARPTSCTADDGPAVCGCDGVVYDSECQAAAQGIDIGAEICETTAGPTGTFGCGPLFCDADTSYCHHGIGDTCDRTYSCQPLPAECQPLPEADCSCFDSGSLGECVTVPGNDVTGVQIDEVLI